MANIDMDKMKAIESAMGQIEKQFGKGSIMKLGEHSSLNVDAISTGSLDLDIALGIGGVPRGRIIEIYGPESSGKTTVALHISAEAQKRGGAVAFIDAEHALDPSYARNVGYTDDFKFKLFKNGNGKYNKFNVIDTIEIDVEEFEEAFDCMSDCTRVKSNETYLIVKEPEKVEKEIEIEEELKNE